MKRTCVAVRTKHSGFTLLEIMVAIGIIALLAAITIGLSNSIMRKAEERQTMDTIRLLQLALREWEIAKGTNMTFEDFHYVDNCEGCYFDVYNDFILGSPTFGLAGVDNGTMLEAMKERNVKTVVVIKQIESSDNILLEITSDYFDGLKVIDSWGTPIGVIFPGQYYAETGLLFFAEDESGDLTIRDQAEDGLGSCINKRPIFVSAGPDRLWGYCFQANGGPGTDEVAKELWNASKDNLYSYEPYIVESAR